MNDRQLIIEAIASLCDGMKRLERAIESDNIDDRAEYVAEAAVRRKRAEQIIIEKLK